MRHRRHQKRRNRQPKPHSPFQRKQTADDIEHTIALSNIAPNYSPQYNIYQKAETSCAIVVFSRSAIPLELREGFAEDAKEFAQFISGVLPIEADSDGLLGLLLGKAHRPHGGAAAAMFGGTG